MTPSARRALSQFEEAVRSQRTEKQMAVMSIYELAAVVNDPTESTQERAKVANALHSRLDEVNGSGWMMMGYQDRANINEALSFDTSQQVFQ